MDVFELVAPSSAIASTLLDELSEKLSSITGDDGRSSYSEENFNSKTDSFIVMKSNGIPVACGALRRIDANTCELKRMYSKINGCGRKLLKHLEQVAKNFGYKDVWLSTRRNNLNAINFYLSHNYQEIAPYGKYKTTVLSVCMGKRISL